MALAFLCVVSFRCIRGFQKIFGANPLEIRGLRRLTKVGEQPGREILQLYLRWAGKLMHWHNVNLTHLLGAGTGAAPLTGILNSPSWAPHGMVSMTHRQLGSFFSFEHGTCWRACDAAFSGVHALAETFLPRVAKGSCAQLAFLEVCIPSLGPPVVPFYPFLGEGSPTKIDCRRKKGTLILTTGGPRSAWKLVRSRCLRAQGTSFISRGRVASASGLAHSRSRLETKLLGRGRVVVARTPF